LRTLTLGVLAHVDAGKTTLTERLLVAAGVLAEPGSVDAGSTHTDTMALERRRGITIRAAVVSFEVDGTTVNLVDTPGHSDFIAEVERALSLLDGAVLVVSAVEGVQAQTLVLMRALQRLGIATVVFVNKVDRAGADPEFVELEVRERLDPDVPVLFGSALKGEGVAELLHALPELLPSREPSTDGPGGRPGVQDRPRRGRRQGGRRPAALGHAARPRPAGPRPRRPRAGHRLRRFHRGGLDTVTEAGGRQVVVLRGLDAARIGDGFGAGAAGMAEEFARPSLATVVEPLDERDRPALYAALDRLAEQDPLISLRVDGRSGVARAAPLPLRRGAAAGDRLAPGGGVRRGRAGSGTPR
jgi:ribosomal protection tetracycline resistance protein